MPRFSNIEIEEILARASQLVVQFISDRVPPPAPVAPTVTGLVGAIQVLGEMSVIVPDLSGFVVYRNTANNSATAIKVGAMPATTEKTGLFTDVTVAFGTNYYYWTKAVDYAGNIGVFSPASASVTSAYLPGSVVLDDSIPFSALETVGSNKALRTNSAGETIDGNSLLDYSDLVTVSATQTITHKDVRLRYRKVTANTTLLATDEMLKVTASAVVTVPLAVGAVGKQAYIDNAHSANTSVVVSGAHTIEGETSQTLYGYACMAIYHDGANWRIK